MPTLEAPTREATDAELAARTRAGDRAALGNLVGRHRGLVWDIVQKVNRPPDIDPDDLAQEGFVAFCRAVPKWREGGGSKLTTFVYTAVQRQLWRSLAQHRRREVAYDPQDDDADGFALARVPDRHRERIDLGSVLAKLSPLDRALVRSHFGVDGEPRGIVANGDRFGLSLTQARRVIAAALADLRDRIDPDEVGWPV